MSRLLVIAPQPFFTARGTPLSVYYRTLVMAEQGVEIDLLTYGIGEDVAIPGVRIVRIPRLPLTGSMPVGPSWPKAILDIPMALWTVGLLLRHRYEVVHAHEEAVFWCQALKPLFGFRMIYDMHSSLPQQLENFRYTRSPLLLGIFRALERRALASANVVVTICRELRDHTQMLGVDPERQLLIENSLFDDVILSSPADRDATAVQSCRAMFGPDCRVIVYAGTFEAYQGIELLVDAFSRVVARVPQARLLLAGGRDEQVANIRARADALGLGATCLLVGQVPKRVASAYMQSADVLVSPRLHGTNTPLKIYEQLASGCPLVATRIRSHTQVLDDSTGFLVEPEPESLAEGLIRALTDSSGVEQRVRGACALYERDYSRSSYEGKIRRLLDMIA
jgi:glycosyltransferase involved in cell wall biosynthesis